MDWKLLFLGGFPPVLAILAELFNPVSGEQGRKHAQVKIDMWVGPRNDGAEVERARNELGDVVAKTCNGAVEVAGLIPTWISVTAGIGALLVERMELLPLVVGALVWAAVTGVLAPYYFLRADYYELGDRQDGRGAKRLSRLLMAANAVIICLAVYCAIGSHFD